MNCDQSFRFRGRPAEIFGFEPAFMPSHRGVNPEGGRAFEL
jgi:hypothetical protein